MSETSNKPVYIGAILAVVAAIAVWALYVGKNEGKLHTPFADTKTAPSDVKTDKNSASDSNKTAQTDANEEESDDETVVVAIVNGATITRQDVVKFIEMLPPQMKQAAPEEMFPFVQDQLIKTKLIEKRAEAADLEEHPEVKKRLDEARENIIRSYYIEKHVDEQLGDDALQEVYDNYVANLPKSEETRARHILVEKEDEAKAIIKALKNGKDFVELAKEKSTGPTGKDGGDLGYFAKGDMVPEFGEAAFAAKVGTVIDKPVKTQFGWHVIKVEDRREKPAPKFEEIKEQLKAKEQQRVLSVLFDRLQREAIIERFDFNGNKVEEKADDSKK